ncbi:hypothetical protein CGL51_07220 [Pyrobaculum aerophilum]|uniref:Uncharacterized protein n=1 Tax=Pyrobaculum aerophilum TaxID=13773 RepID=A0A371QY90_9CREN|nr:hypothetical protein CGL51_07220 [Pyrobaculum aerophilum]RFB00212.1 hypothetical protein CGL52_01070 [Pyrobaculum aerophilum]
MVITLQRSVTFPPIRLRRIDEYIHYVAKNAPTLEELRERGLEIGRGRGDITRLLERIQVVEVNNNRVSLTSAGRQLVSLREALSLSVYHALFFQRLSHYKLLVETLAELREGDFENLHGAVNERLSRISPTAWLNKVAFKTLLQIAEDVGAVEKRNGIYYYRGDPVEKAVSEYYEKHGVKIGSNYYVAVDKVLVEECAKEEKPHNLYKVDTGCTVTKIYNFFVI